MLSRSSKILLATFFALSIAIPLHAKVCDIGSQTFCQEFDGIGNAYASQNDTNDFGLYAQVYDNFRASISSIWSIRFEGEYFNPPQQGPISGWTASLFTDAGGRPGALLQTTHISGNGNETFDGNFGGFPAYVYTLDTPNWFLSRGTQGWVSVYPDLGFPPQWGWSSGTGGDGISYQDFFGVRGQLPADMAFALSGGGCAGLDCGVPEPGTLLMVGTGAASAGAYYADALGLSALGLLRSLSRKILRRSLLTVGVLALLLVVPSWADVCGIPDQFYCQEFDHTGNGYFSQNDTNGYGLFAQVYDNFTGVGKWLMQLKFEGEYANPPEQGDITGWTFGFYDDNGGQPGTLLRTEHQEGHGNETFDGNFGGFPAYTYLFNVGGLFDSRNYWVSVYPDLGYPPQWAWSTSTGGDGVAYSDYFGSRVKLDADMAFAISGQWGCMNLECGGHVPEPGTLLMVATGAAGAGAYYADILGLSTFGIFCSRRKRTRE